MNNKQRVSLLQELATTPVLMNKGQIEETLSITVDGNGDYTVYIAREKSIVDVDTNGNITAYEDYLGSVHYADDNDDELFRRMLPSIYNALDEQLIWYRETYEVNQ